MIDQFIGSSFESGYQAVGIMFKDLEGVEQVLVYTPTRTMIMSPVGFQVDFESTYGVELELSEDQYADLMKNFINKHTLGFIPRSKVWCMMFRCLMYRILGGFVSPFKDSMIDRFFRHFMDVIFDQEVPEDYSFIEYMNMVRNRGERISKFDLNKLNGVFSGYFSGD